MTLTTFITRICFFQIKQLPTNSYTVVSTYTFAVEKKDNVRKDLYSFNYYPLFIVYFGERLKYGSEYRTVIFKTIKSNAIF